MMLGSMSGAEIRYVASGTPGSEGSKEKKGGEIDEGADGHQGRYQSSWQLAADEELES